MLAATVIGDVVRSRSVTDRTALHDRIREALCEVNETLSPRTPLRITIGDEYQGTFDGVGDAIRATLRLRLALSTLTELRHGIGWGEVNLLQEEPRVEDGPGWWAARDAIKVVERAEHRAGTRLRRTAFRRAGDADGADPATLEAMLILRDQMVGDLSERSLVVLRGLLEGTTQRDLAAELGVSASAVSQRVRADGLAALVAADAALAVSP